MSVSIAPEMPPTKVHQGLRRLSQYEYTTA